MPDSDIKDLTVLILRDIRAQGQATNLELGRLRDDVRGTNERLDALNERVDGLAGEIYVLTDKVHVMSERLDITNERLSLVEQTVKVAADRIGSVVRVVTDRHETAIDDLRERVTRLEAKARG